MDAELDFELGGESGPTIAITPMDLLNLKVVEQNIPNLGRDISCVSGLDPNFTLTSGVTCVAQAIARRLSTPRGGLFYDPNYGTDVREILAAKIDRRRLEDWRSRIETEVRKDDRVDSVAVSLVFDPTAESLRIRVTGTVGTGPFDLTLAVTDLSVELIPVG